ncbi:MAG: amino acid permease [Saprospiraceae bacterium]|nr:amino acid permease [Saprospiraceae bacterium]
MALRRSLTLSALTMIAIGSTIGSGIFRTPGRIAEAVHLPEYVILIWVLGGLAALAGALTYAEMGSMYPKAGGLYVYLREAYGDTVGFLYGWYILFISTSGSIAAVAVVCAEHLLLLFGIDGGGAWVVPLAALITIGLTIVNLFGVNVGGWMAQLFTSAKLLGLAVLILAGLAWALPEVAAANRESVFANTPPVYLWSAIGTAFVGVLWSYGGWQHASFMAGETRDPQRTVPLAMILGASVVTLMYVLANVSYMRLLPVEQIAQSKTVAADALGMLSPWGRKFMALVIALSTFGTTAIYCMTAPRIYYAMAADGLFFQKLARVHPRWQTPVNAMLIQGVWSVVLLLFWGTFESLIDYVTFMDWIGLALAGAAIFVFRRRLPDVPRGYRTWGYPVTPLVFIGIATWFVTATLVEKPGKALAGFAVVLVGWAAYYWLFRPGKATAPDAER